MTEMARYSSTTYNSAAFQSGCNKQTNIVITKLCEDKPAHKSKIGKKHFALMLLVAQKLKIM